MTRAFAALVFHAHLPSSPTLVGSFRPSISGKIIGVKHHGVSQSPLLRISQLSKKILAVGPRFRLRIVPFTHGPVLPERHCSFRRFRPFPPTCITFEGASGRLQNRRVGPPTPTDADSRIPEGTLGFLRVSFRSAVCGCCDTRSAPCMTGWHCAERSLLI
jgi:hypothetical protein